MAERFNSLSTKKARTVFSKKRLVAKKHRFFLSPSRLGW
jgi:hypothetical protein